MKKVLELDGGGGICVYATLLSRTLQGLKRALRWYMLIILTFKMLRQEDCYKLEGNLGYIYYETLVKKKTLNQNANIICILHIYIYMYI